VTGVHHRIYDLIDSVKFHNQIIMSLSIYPPHVREIKLRLILKLMFRLKDDILGACRGRAFVELVI